MNEEIAKIYGSRVRVRVCGLCWRADSLLLINHNLNKGDFWAFPGGGVEFGQTLAENLKREFREETNLVVKPGAFLFGCEFLKEPLHAIELFFAIDDFQGTLQTGSDPELQIIQEAKFLTPDQLWGKPPAHVHGIFRIARNVDELRKLNGFYSI